MAAKVLAISGEKNTGKTTLIAALVERLVGLGIKVAVVKHDGHSFSPDVPGTDTHRFLTAGAMGAAVFDGEKYMLTKHTRTDELALAAAFPETDLVLMEGLKHSAHPKLLISKDHHVQCSFSPARFHRDDVAGMLKLVLDYLEVETPRD